MNTSLSTYSAYTIVVSNDPSYYGTDCTQADADRITDSLREMIRGEFPGINVTTSGRDNGPDSAVLDEVREWVATNWTAAL